MGLCLPGLDGALDNNINYQEPGCDSGCLFVSGGPGHTYCQTGVLSVSPGHYLSHSGMDTIIHVTVISKLDYYNSFYGRCPMRLIQKLHPIQNEAARVLMWSPCTAHIQSFLHELHWLPRIKIMTLIFKALNDQEPMYLSDCLSCYSP